MSPFNNFWRWLVTFRFLLLFALPRHPQSENSLARPNSQTPDHEILGIGDIFLKDGKPKIHLHAGAGRGDNTKLGCLRGESEVFMVIEAFVFELEGISARRIADEEQGFAPVDFERVSDLE